MYLKKTSRSVVTVEANQLFCACWFLDVPGECKSPPDFLTSHKYFIDPTTQYAKSSRTLSVYSPRVGHWPLSPSQLHRNAVE